jgi:hypothetical protein
MWKPELGRGARDPRRDLHQEGDHEEQAEADSRGRVEEAANSRTKAVAVFSLKRRG